MPQCKALKTFNSTQYGFIRAGSHFSSEPQYAQDLLRHGLIEIEGDSMQPSRTQAMLHAPVTQGKEPPSAPPLAVNRSVTVDRRDDGEEKLSASSRADRASHHPTSSTSKGNAKR